MKSTRMTKQGVRDLGGNGRQPKPHRRELPLPVKRALCPHPVAARAEGDYRVRCLDCGDSWSVVG